MPDALPPEHIMLEARPRPPRRRRSRIAIAALVSLVLHAAVLGGAWWWWARHKAQIALVPVNMPPIVQLVMTPPGGKAQVAQPSKAPEPAPKTPKPAAKLAKQPPPAPAKTAKAEQSPVHRVPIPESAPARTKTEAPKPEKTPESAAEAPKATEAPKTAEAESAKPAPALHVAPDDKLQLNLSQAESDTNAWVTGSDVLPPSAAVKFHNRKPSYPDDAVLRGEQGAVVLLVHVTAAGLVSGVDVLKSSGHAALDRAARDAVLTWHFLPSIRDGQPVPAVFPARFVFALD
jgi:protein TonB